MNDTVTGKISEPLRFEDAEVAGVYYGLITNKLVKLLHRYCRVIQSHRLKHDWDKDSCSYIGILVSGLSLLTPDILVQKVTLKF